MAIFLIVLVITVICLVVFNIFMRPDGWHGSPDLKNEQKAYFSAMKSSINSIKNKHLGNVKDHLDGSESSPWRKVGSELSESRTQGGRYIE